jgi:hypothetical protein
MLLRRFSSHVQSGNWFAVFLDIIVVVVGFGLIVACSTADQSPDDMYQEYHRQVATGLSIEEERAFLSSRKNKEMASERKAMDASTLAQIAPLVVDTFRCMGLKLVDESVNTDTAFLTYEVVGICESTAGDTGKLSVRLVMENGWKIDHILLEV